MEHDLILVPLYLSQIQSFAQREELRRFHPWVILLLSSL